MVSVVGFEPTKHEATGLQPAETLQRPRTLNGSPCGIRTRPSYLERVVTSPEVERCILHLNC